LPANRPSTAYQSLGFISRRYHISGQSALISSLGQSARLYSVETILLCSSSFTIPRDLPQKKRALENIARSIKAPKEIFDEINSVLQKYKTKA
jgi:hypothetical protein